jgi:N-methylhydantoinase B
MTRSESGTRDSIAVDIDPFTAEIIRNYLLSTVREMIGVTRLAAYSTCFSEALDFTCALFDDKGRLFAQAGGNPVHFGGLEDEVRIMLKKAGHFAEGDVILHNDPFEGADHQSDVVLAMPMFWKDELVGFSVNRGHWMDIGSMFAGGYGLSTHVVQEGLILPACKLYRGGVLRREVQDFILKNVRMPQQIWGDIQAQIASAKAAATRVGELIDRYDLSRVRAAIEHSLEYAHRRFRERMEDIPEGIYVAEDSMDDDGLGGGPFRVKVTIVKIPDKIVVDFEGTDPQAAGSANATMGTTQAATYTALKALIDPDIPFNSGILDLIEIKAPPGTIVNPSYPAPVCCAPADPTNRVCETVMRALAPVLPARVMAGTYATGLNSTGWGFDKDGREFMWYVFGPGGCGARKEKDGLTMEWHTMASCANESIEVWEARYPVRIIERGLRTDSGGPGRMRGGLGDVRSIECLSDTLISAFMDRCISQPWGAAGGLPGASNAFAVERQGKEYTFDQLFGLSSPSKFSNAQLGAGDCFIVRSGGGGGHGAPEGRDPELVAWDVKNGYISEQAAREIYKVAVRPNGSVDTESTSALRGRRYAGKSSGKMGGRI